MQAIVLDPGGQDIQAGQIAESTVLDRHHETSWSEPRTRVGESVQEAETRSAALAKRRQCSESVVLGIASLRRPALRINRCEAGAAFDDDAKARAEVFDFLVAQVTDDLDRRPLDGYRVGAPGRFVEVLQQGIEHAWKARELGPGIGQDVQGFVHVLTPPSSALYPRSINEHLT